MSKIYLGWGIDPVKSDSVIDCGTFDTVEAAEAAVAARGLELCEVETSFTKDAIDTTCPSCGGRPEQDEDGRYFICFFCCDTGIVSKEVADELEREEQLRQDHANSLGRRIKHCRFDHEEDRCITNHGALFTGLPGLRPKRNFYPACPAEYTDIPF